MQIADFKTRTPMYAFRSLSIHWIPPKNVQYEANPSSLLRNDLWLDDLPNVGPPLL